MTLQTDGRTDGQGYHNIPAFSPKRAGITMQCYQTQPYCKRKQSHTPICIDLPCSGTPGTSSFLISPLQRETR